MLFSLNKTLLFNMKCYFQLSTTVLFLYDFFFFLLFHLSYQEVEVSTSDFDKTCHYFNNMMCKLSMFFNVS